MRNLLALVGLAVVLVAVVGHYQNWYVVEKTSDGWYRISFDTNKAKADAERAEDAITGKK